MGKVRIGISGWRYSRWRGNFYPPDLAQRDELHYASRQLDSIEISGTFYGLQRPGSYSRWDAQTPRGFAFAVKAPRFVTHMRRLRECKLPLADFMASGVLDLKEKLGPILWQFPPSMRHDEALFAAFFKLLPHNAAQAIAIAHQHDGHLA